MNNYDEVLGYDCDGNEVHEFRILRFPFSADVDNWDDVPFVDPRFYCLVKSSSGEVYAVSVYDRDCWICKYIRRYENIKDNEAIPMLVKPASISGYYEVAFDGILGNEWYYDRDKEELRKRLDGFLKEQKVKKLEKK